MKIIRWPELQQKIGGYSRMTVWRWENAGVFPKRVRLDAGSVAWIESEVDDWIEKRASERLE